jgi:hypothetical protein
VAGKIQANTEVEAAELCNDMLRECKASAVHIEMRDDYTPDDPWFRAWREGDREEFERQLARSWLDEIRQVIARGVVVRRLRMVSEPVTDYIRFECDTTRSNVETGEHVRWLSRRRAADLLLPGNDCWVFDSRRVLFNYFDGPGEWAGAEACDVAEVAARHTAAFDIAWERDQVAVLVASLRAAEGHVGRVAQDGTYRPAAGAGRDLAAI